MSTRRRETAEAFVQAMVKRYGGSVRTLRKNAIEAHFTQTPPFLDQKAVTIAFERKALDHHPDARLAIPGSPFFVELLELARKRGQVSRVFTPIVEPFPADLFAGPIEAEGPVEIEVGETRNDPHIVFNFAISYQSVLTSDGLLSIGYDVARESFRSPEIIDALHSLWGETLVECPGEWERLDLPEVRALVPKALEEVNRRICKKVAKARRTAQQLLEREVQSIEDYYRQLIAEERELLNKATSASAKEVKDHEARIRRFQLDWKRRTAEEARHHQCRVHVRLVSWAVVYMPRTQVDFVFPEGKISVDGTQNGRNPGTNKFSSYFNHFVGTFDGIVCSETGAERGPWTVSAEGTWRSRGKPGPAGVRGAAAEAPSEGDRTSSDGD